MEVKAANDSGGVGMLGMWAVLVDTSGVVCAVANTEEGNLSVNAELAHRILAAHKANTSNIFSNNKATTASGQLYTQSLPGGTLYNVNLDSKVDPYSGNVRNFGTLKDPLIGKRIGGFSSLAGGLGLYDAKKTKVGAIGVSGNSRCTDHLVAWKIRDKLAGGAYVSSNIPGGFSPLGNDALVLDVSPDPTGSGGPGYSPRGLEQA
jgi:hypothetical protein